MQDFREVAVWRKAHGLVLRIYQASKDFPQSENFGLILNLRRSATARATRIAEGAGRPSDEEFSVELKRARGTGYELEYLLLLSRDLGFLDAAVHDELTSDVIEVRKMLSGFMKKLTVGR